MKRLTINTIWVTAALLVLSCGLLFVYRGGFPPTVPLWYSRPWGQDQLASPWWLWLFPILIGLMGGLGLWGKKLLNGDNLLASLWTATLLIVEFILTLALVRIVWLVLL